jgi:hypothetical protein
VQHKWVVRTLVSCLAGSLPVFGQANITFEAHPDAGQVNISGATLFQSFFTSGASTVDHIDVDGDGFAGFDPDTAPFVQQLAPSFSCTLNTFWLVQYRGVGSGNGLAEFVDFQLGVDTDAGVDPDPGLAPGLPATYSSDFSIINRGEYASGGTPTGNGTALNCGLDEPQGRLTGTPWQQTSVDIGVMDVPTSWFVQSGDVADANPFAKPGASGYGRSPRLSVAGQSNRLKVLDRPGRGSLNINVAAPDAFTVFDTPIAWVPVAYIANRGTGVSQIKVTELQHAYLSGRLPTGENLNIGSRDAGSGTRNAAMNSIGLDPSWGLADNRDPKWATRGEARLGGFDDGVGDGAHKWTNINSSSRLEDATQNNRLMLAYTGLYGNSKAAEHTVEGKIETIDVMFDDRGGTQYVRPSVQNTIENSDPNTGYQIGGPETFATLGTWDQDLIDAGAPAMANPAAAAYIRNIVGSIALFTGAPADDENFFTPGDLLTTQFLVQSAIDAAPLPLDPADFQPNPDFVQSVKDFSLANTSLYDVPNQQTLPDWGTVNPAGKTPTRSDLTGTGLTYSDGSVTGEYLNPITGVYGELLNAVAGIQLTGGQNLNARNALAGDFNNDGVRDINDIPEMLVAVAAEQNWSGPGSTAADPAVAAILGDYNGDGNFDAEDIRFFADGLALVGGTLDRGAGFAAVDTAFGGNYFGTTTATGFGLPVGGSAADIAGNTPAPGAEPRGWDGTVDAQDIDYVRQSFGDFTVVLEALHMDLSADMNGDLVVDQSDVDFVVRDVLCTEYGDVDLDGDVDGDDLQIVQNTIASSPLCVDPNCDGVVDFFDIDPFVVALVSGQPTWEATYGCDFVAANDANGDGVVDFFDIDAFVTVVVDGCPVTGGWADGDVNGDGLVNSADEQIVNDNLGFTSACAS